MAKIEIEGGDQVKKALTEVYRAMSKDVANVVQATAATVRKDAIKSMRQASQGRTYQRGKKAVAKGYKRRHVASKKGDAPNIDRGRLVGSIKAVKGRTRLTAYVGTNLDYGAYLELRKQRPWLLPALKRNKKTFDKLIQKVLKAKIKNAGKK